MISINIQCRSKPMRRSDLYNIHSTHTHTRTRECSNQHTFGTRVGGPGGCGGPLWVLCGGRLGLGFRGLNIFFVCSISN